MTAVRNTSTAGYDAVTRFMRARAADVPHLSDRLSSIYTNEHGVTNLMVADIAALLGEVDALRDELSQIKYEEGLAALLKSLSGISSTNKRSTTV